MKGYPQGISFLVFKTKLMQLEDYFDFLRPDDIRVKGTRVGIETILYDFIHRSRTPEEIAQSYPSVTLEQVGSIPIVQMYPTSRGAGEQGSRGENRFKFSYIPVHQNIFAKTGCTQQVYATILYYLHNKEFVSAYIADWLEHGHRAREEQKRNPPPVSEKLRKLRAERAFYQ